MSGSHVIKWKGKETQGWNVVYSNRNFPGLPLSQETPVREAEGAVDAISPLCDGEEACMSNAWFNSLRL